MITEHLKKINSSIPSNVTLVAVSKTKPMDDIMQAYNWGQRVFGENKIQEMVEKHKQLPDDIEWHMIGHVQTNKVKYMADFVHLIHAVDSLKLLQEINKQAAKHQRVIQCLLQIKIAQEDSKFGMSATDAKALLEAKHLSNLNHISIVGLMGMATYTNNIQQIEEEFKYLKSLYDTFKIQHSAFKILSMGMSGDYPLAIACGSNMIRVGSSIFGDRN